MEPRQNFTSQPTTLDLRTLDSLVESADLALETLRAVSLQFNQNPYPTHRFLVRETIASCRLAGSTATLLDLLCFQEAPEFLSPNPDVRGQSDYLAALSFGQEQARQGNLDALTVQGIFERLCPETKINTQEEPSSGSRVMTLLADHAQLHPLLRAGLLHSQVLATRPFPKANDLMARILSTLLLAMQKQLFSPSLCLSPYFEKHAETYTLVIHQGSRPADPSAWLAFFIDGLRHQATDTTRRLQALLELMDRYRGIVVRQGKGTRSAFKIMEHLMKVPLLTARALVEKADMSAPTAQRALRVWVEAGVIQELTGHKSGRIYLATELFHLATEQWMTHAA